MQLFLTDVKMFLIVAAIVIPVFAVAILIVIAVDRLAKRSVRRKIERLRQSGILPDPGSDTDIIRLANEEKREEAALLYMTLHGGDLDTARITVGKGTRPTTLMVIIFTVFILIAALDPLLRGQSISPFRLVMWSVIFIGFLIAWKRARKTLAANRATLAEGHLPQPPARK